MEETWKRQLLFFKEEKEREIPFRDSSRVTRNSLPFRERELKKFQHRESVVEKKKMEEREREATLVETQALSVSHSKFSFPTSVLPRPPSVSASPSLIPRLDLQVQTSTMKFLHELFLRDRRPSFNMADPGPGSVRANLADQTEAKSHAFVRVNSIHCLSLSPTLATRRPSPTRYIYLSLSSSPLHTPSIAAALYHSRLLLLLPFSFLSLLLAPLHPVFFRTTHERDRSNR